MSPSPICRASATASCFECLAAHGFTLGAWRHQEFVKRTFGTDTETRVFRRGTMHGLLDYDAAKNELRVIALRNEVRGNGHFLKVVGNLESVARKTGARLLVVQFENERLSAWFGRRPCWLRWKSTEHGEHAEFVP